MEKKKDDKDEAIIYPQLFMRPETLEVMEVAAIELIKEQLTKGAKKLTVKLKADYSVEIVTPLQATPIQLVLKGQETVLEIGMDGEKKKEEKNADNQV